jgi:hypothetical protein
MAVAGTAVCLSACGAPVAVTGSTQVTVSTVTPTRPTAASVNGEVAVAFPVVTCTTAAGGAAGPAGWKPTVLLAPIPTTLVNKVEFYSDGTHTLLGPIGWGCTQTSGAGGAGGLAVYPSTGPAPPQGGPPAPGAQGVFAVFDTTGHVQGIALVCPFFTVPSWQAQEGRCTGTLPNGEQSSMPTPDVASVTDPAGVIGSLEGSGGFGPVTGTVIFPQVEPAVTEGAAVAVAEESCSLPDPSLCPTVLSDFDVREFPAPAPAYQAAPIYRSPSTTVAPTTTGPPPSASPTTPATTKAPPTTKPPGHQRPGP